MIRTFVLGIVIGLIATVAGAYYLPVVDQAREVSLVRVQTNGGQQESFHINIPMDQVAVGASGQGSAVPTEIEWPEELSAHSASVYKLRNEQDVVIGVAHRVVVQDEQFGNAIEWVLHFPARGSLYVSMPTQVSGDESRRGRVVSGTREFSGARGLVSEDYLPIESGDEMRRGRIELKTLLGVSPGGAE